MPQAEFISAEEVKFHLGFPRGWPRGGGSEAAGRPGDCCDQSGGRACRGVKREKLLIHHTKRFARGKTLPQAEFISAEEVKFHLGFPRGWPRGGGSEAAGRPGDCCDQSGGDPRGRRIIPHPVDKNRSAFRRSCFTFNVPGPQKMPPLERGGGPRSGGEVSPGRSNRERYDRTRGRFCPPLCLVSAPEGKFSGDHLSVPSGQLLSPGEP